jgi:hypothetical protein
MKELIQQTLNKINKDNIYSFDKLDIGELKDALKDEGYNKRSSIEEIEEGINDLFDSCGCEGFGIYEVEMLSGEIKSVGFNIEGGGEVLDDSEGVDERWFGYMKEGEVVGFEEGVERLKEYVLEEKGEVEEGSGEGFWKKIEGLLMKIKKEVGDGGRWVLWGVEYDYNLGVIK